ncbi:E3 ubiquitin-protein ligase TRIM21-like [Solea solea]|uniref:E3 ubiquitin-protein ligase TRIM21-like n=1 Tax=Solea solea TaxID=90069 RepID=UPI00272CAC1F|nr:E3 ubiquitin-protein ligase TRIM21-like [Solea solea]
MASSSDFLSEDQFACSICLDVFTEPVSIPCGHNFCKACITRHWENKAQCQCPLCSEKFKKGLKLCVNTGFREVVNNFKKHGVSNKNDVLVKPGQVPCDCCTGNKFKAFKTCLVCLASYCQTHLEPHQRVAALKKHKLTDPVQNLEANVCKKHNKMLELFCRNDRSRVCALCTEHRGHDTIPLEEEYEEKQGELEQKKMEVNGMIQERQKKILEITEGLAKKREQNNEANGNSVQVFTSLIVSMQQNLSGLVNAFEERQRAAEKQADVLVVELQREIMELQRSLTKLQKISKTEDHLQLIKRFLSITSTFPLTKDWSEVSISGQHCVQDLKRAIVQLQVTLAKEVQRAGQDFRACYDEFLAEETSEDKKMVHTDLENLPEGIKLDIIRQQYTVDMTFDPCSANDLLVFSEDFKAVQTPHIVWVNGSPQKFNRHAYVLGKRGFSRGRFYYEVQTARKTGWDLGIVRESLRGMKTIIPNPRTGVWVIRLRNNTKFTALNNVHVNLNMSEKPNRVGVFVDYEQRLVSFYDVDTVTLLYSFTDCLFSGKIYPFFSPGLPEDGVNGGPLVLSPDKKEDKKSNKKENKEEDKKSDKKENKEEDKTSDKKEDKTSVFFDWSFVVIFLAWISLITYHIIFNKG